MTVPDAVLGDNERMKLASFDALVKALDDAHVRYLVAGCPQDKSERRPPAQEAGR